MMIFINMSREDWTTAPVYLFFQLAWPFNSFSNIDFLPILESFIFVPSYREHKPCRTLDSLTGYYNRKSGIENLESAASCLSFSPLKTKNPYNLQCQDTHFCLTPGIYSDGIVALR
jgi:hypothetical protein